jgi:hypothetical protein
MLLGYQTRSYLAILPSGVFTENVEKDPAIKFLILLMGNHQFPAR